MNYEILDIQAVKLPEERQRREIDTKRLEELANSIAVNGLFHAPILDQNGILVAGWCRYQAVRILAHKNIGISYNAQEIPKGMIPVIRTGKKDPRELFRIELEENVRRTNLSHADQAVAIATLHNMYEEEDETWTKKSTAEKLLDLGRQGSLSGTEAEVSNALLISQFADDPEVRKARTKGQALRIAKRKREQELLSALGGTEAAVSASSHQVVHGSAFEVLPGFERGSFDCIITDPPYGIGADSFGDASFMGQAHGYADSWETARACYELLADEGYWQLREQGHLFVFCDIRHFPGVVQIFLDQEHEGWFVWPTPVLWYKGTTAHAPRPDHGPKRTYEAILFASKGEKRVQKCGSDIIQVPGVWRDVKRHPAEKPTELYEELLQWSCWAGSRLLDPFCGSGVIFEAAERNGCEAVGIEMEEKYVQICRKRITDALAEPKDDDLETIFGATAKAAS